MVERKSGPVKPPVLDLKASEKANETAKDTTSASASPDPKGQNSAPSVDETGPAGATGKPTGGASATTQGETAKADQTVASTNPTKRPSSSDADEPPVASRDTKAEDAKTRDTKATQDAESPKAGRLPPPPPAPGVPPTPKRDAQKQVGPTPFIATALGGAVLGLGFAYGLALSGLWPSVPAAPAATPDDVAALQSRLDALEAQTGAPPIGLAELDARIADIETALVTPTDAPGADDLAALQANVSELSGRVEAIAAGASGDDAEALGSEIATLREDVQSALDQIGAVASSADLATLAERLEALETAAASQPELDTLRAERDRFAQLPSALSGLETAFETGAPYTDQLFALNDILPDLSVPDSVTAASASGLPTYSDIAETFSRQIPAILSGAAPSEGQDWLARLAGQAQAALALRPVGDVEGDTPEAIVARTEAAIARRDAQAALNAIQQLPERLLTRTQPTIAALEARIAGEDILAQARALANPTPVTNEEPGA